MQICDECEKKVPSITRKYKGRKYCATCYNRVFKLKACPSCGIGARLNKYEHDAICTKCVRNKPCARCNKLNYKSGKLTPYGMVCNSCSPYFRKKEPCNLCGVASSRLSRLSRLNHDLRICPKCQRADHASCDACKRHRLLSISKKGQMLCKKCLKQGDAFCLKCSSSMSAGYGNRCERCYWLELLGKRISINCAVFRSIEMAQHFKTFLKWLSIEVGFHKAAMTLNRYLLFFVEIEQSFGCIPNYALLLHNFGAAKLRKSLLSMKWMEQSGLIIVDAKLRENNTEKRRIDALLNKLNGGTKERMLVEGYYQRLNGSLKLNKTTLRSIRLAVSPAASLLLKGAENDITPPTQKLLNDFLEKSPGQRAAISGFICYLRNAHDVEIKLPIANKYKSLFRRRARLEAEVLKLIEAGEANVTNPKWLSVALAYFHGLAKNVGSNISTKDVVDSKDGGFSVIWRNQKYWVSRPHFDPSQTDCK